MKALHVVVVYSETNIHPGALKCTQDAYRKIAEKCVARAVKVLGYYSHVYHIRDEATPVLDFPW